MATFDQSTPFMLLARIHVKPGCIEQYLELARMTDAAVQSSEPGMLHHTFDQDPEDPKHLYGQRSMPMTRHLQKHAELGDRLLLHRGLWNCRR